MTYKKRIKEWIKENWLIIVVIILVLFLITRIQVPSRLP